MSLRGLLKRAVKERDAPSPVEEQLAHEERLRRLTAQVVALDTQVTVQVAAARRKQRRAS